MPNGSPAPDGEERSSAVRVGAAIAGGKYFLDAVLGEGGMGVVYAATHVELDQRVAVKVVRADLARKGESHERMLWEARVAARLRSEHVARVLDVGRLESGEPFIVMEYLEGQDLASRLAERGPQRVDRVIDQILQACEALAEAHAVGIVHRDIKPDNLFVTEVPGGVEVVKVLDFGISTNLSAERRACLTQPTMVVGSPEYMAPEQMRPQSEVDVRSDIWALGAVLYELLVGHRPFQAETFPEICSLVLTSEPVRLRAYDPSIPDELERVVMRCLQKAPGDRFATVADFACALVPFGPPQSGERAERIVRIASCLPRPSRAATHPGSGAHHKPRDSRSPVSCTAPPRARTARWARATFLGAGVAALSAISIFSLSAFSDRRAEGAAARGAAPSLAPAPPPLASTKLEASSSGDDAARGRLDLLEPGSSPASEVRASQVAASARRPPAKRSAAAPVSSSRPPSEPSVPPGDASATLPEPSGPPVPRSWDPQAFGGRR